MKRLKDKYIKLDSDYRMFNFEKPIIALTGGIASGKSTVTKLLQAKGLKIIDADALVKSIYAKSESQEFIRTNFPSAWKDGAIDFPALRELFFQTPRVKELVESFIYSRLPLAFREEAMKVKDQDFFIYDVPLLFERQLETKVDLTIVVYAPRSVQLARLIERDGNRGAVGNSILDQQMDIELKKQKADFVVDNSGTLEELTVNVDQLLRQLFD